MLEALCHTFSLLRHTIDSWQSSAIYFYQFFTAVEYFCYLATGLLISFATGLVVVSVLLKMTISYSDRFSRLLLRWKGSLWKTIYKDLFIFLVLYYFINFIYRNCLSKDQREIFGQISLLFNEYTKQIPLTFLLGFYVGMVVKRWWEQFQFIAFPDALMMAVSSYIRGQRDDAKIIRRTIARYSLATCVLAWRTLSQRVLKRFPTEEHLVSAELLTPEEFAILKAVKVDHDPHGRWLIPICWIQSIFIKCFDQKRLTRTNELRALLVELDKFRVCFLQGFLLDWVSIPLVYTQVATIATYGYFALCLVARQYPTKPVTTSTIEQVDVYIPIFTILQFLFYVGWLKVGEDLMNPFGEDDEDFELNYLLDRHTEIVFLLVDTLHGQMPSILEQIDITAPLQHTKGSAKVPEHRPVCHIDEDELNDADMELATDSLLELRESMMTDSNMTAKEKLVSCCATVGRTVYSLRPTNVITDRVPSQPVNARLSPSMPNHV